MMNILRKLFKKKDKAPPICLLPFPEPDPDDPLAPPPGYYFEVTDELESRINAQRFLPQRVLPNLAVLLKNKITGNVIEYEGVFFAKEHSLEFIRLQISTKMRRLKTKFIIARRLEKRNQEIKDTLLGTYPPKEI